MKKNLLNRNSLQAYLALLPLTIFGGCAHPVANEKPADVAIPRDCENLPGKVPLASISPGLDPRVAIARADAQTKKANQRIAMRDACIAQVREEFAGAAKK